MTINLESSILCNTMTPTDYIIIGLHITTIICCSVAAYILGRSHSGKVTQRCCEHAYAQGRRDALNDIAPLKPLAPSTTP